MMFDDDNYDTDIESVYRSNNNGYDYTSDSDSQLAILNYINFQGIALLYRTVFENVCRFV